MELKKGDLVKYRKYIYHTYRIYRIRAMDEHWIVLVPALNYINTGQIKLPIKYTQIPDHFSLLTDEERQEFLIKEFENGCYRACVDINRLNNKLEELSDKSDSHRIKGEISITLNKINTIFNMIEKNWTNDEEKEND